MLKKRLTTTFIHLFLAFCIISLWHISLTRKASGDDHKLLFGSPVDYDVGAGPHSVFSADLNQDGSNDLVVANISSDSISVLINLGDGTFGHRTDYETGWHPHSVFSIDLDGNGNNDLAVANNATNNVSVLLNNGNGVFTPKADYQVGSSPVLVSAADLDKDSDEDLVVVNNGGNVSVMLNSGNGTFEQRIDYGTGSQSFSVSISDFDGDGNKDLAVANGGSNSVSVLLNNGNGEFASKFDYATAEVPISVFGVDLNGDGHEDLAVANRISNSVSVLLNNGDGTFAPKVDYITGIDPRSVFGTDLDGDGDSDLAIANWDGTVSLLLNYGNGEFAPKVDCYGGNIGHLTSIFSSDLDGDENNDLAVTNYSDNNVLVLLNQGISVDEAFPVLDFIFPAPNSVNASPNTNIKVTFSFDAERAVRDNSVLVYGEQTGFHKGRVDYNPSTRTLSFEPDLVFSYGEKVTVMIPKSPRSGSIEKFIFKFTIKPEGGQGNFSIASCQLYNMWGYLLPSDYDKDGDIDLAIAYYGSAWNNSNLYVTYNNGSGDFALEPDSYELGPMAIAAMGSDFNRDGYNDVAVVDYRFEKMFVLLNAQDGSFNTPVEYGTILTPDFATAGCEDINNDGYLVSADFLLSYLST